MVDSFDKKYFDLLYAKGETIDGDFNAQDHARYLHSLFSLMGYHVGSVYDFGFGKGQLLHRISKKLEAPRVGGCDVSAFAFKKLSQKKYAQDWDLKNCSILDLKPPAKPYSLGLCNSVLQYLKTEKEVEQAVKLLKEMCHYVYLHVPTQEDYRLLKKQLGFQDPYAQKRKDAFYRSLLQKHFHFVSWGLLESKKFLSHRSSIFSDSLYRH